MIKKIISKIKRKYAEYKGGETYINYLRQLGIRIGTHCHIGIPRTITIDYTRPYLIEIGNNVRMNNGFTLLTHDFATSVLTNKYGDFLPSSGKVKIGNNVYFAQKCTVMKGVTIGDNCIIGYGSLVTKNIPSNSVVAGSPARVICTLEEYYEKRKVKALEESLAVANEIEKYYKRKPVPTDFREEFVYFVSGNEIEKYPKLPIRHQLTTMGDCFDRWVREHKAPYKSFEEFLDAANKSKKEE